MAQNFTDPPMTSGGGDWFDQNAPGGTGGAQPRATAENVALMYRNLLGREASPEEIQNQLTGGSYDLNTIQGSIASSAEAQAYAQAHPTGVQTGTSGGSKPSAQDFIKQWQQSHPNDVSIGPLADAMQAAGYTNVSRFMYGATPSNNELSIDGQKFKVLAGEDSGNPSWYTGGNDSLGGNQYGALGMADPSTGFGAPPAPYVSNPNAPTYTAPTVPSYLSTPYTAATFTAPTPAEVMAQPDYQFGLDQGTKQIQRSAAAKGTVLNPGTVQALNRYGTDYATTKYGDVLNRDIGIFGMNESNRFGARQQNQSEYQSNVVNPAQQTFQNQYASYLNDNARTLQDYLTNYNIQHTAETDTWGRLKDVSNSGLTAALGSRAS